MMLNFSIDEKLHRRFKAKTALENKKMVEVLNHLVKKYVGEK